MNLQNVGPLSCVHQTLIGDKSDPSIIEAVEGSRFSRLRRSVDTNCSRCQNTSRSVHLLPNFPYEIRPRAYLRRRFYPWHLYEGETLCPSVTGCSPPPGSHRDKRTCTAVVLCCFFLFGDDFKRFVSSCWTQ